MKQFKLLTIGLSAMAAMCMAGCDKGDTIGGCMTSSDCPHPALYKCDTERNACLEINPPHCSDQKMNSDETDVDCGGSCDPCAEGESCDVNADCMTHKCNDGECVIVSCEDADDCKGTGHSCDDGVCNTCSDKIQNGNESDVDCGGKNTGCEKCDNDKKCSTNSDCKSGTCGEGNTCEAVACTSSKDCKETETCEDSKCISCSDGIMNGNETAIDCGGELCQKCGLGKGCATNDDCDGELVCEGEVCTEKGVTPVDLCANNQKDANETDVDCGGSSGCTACEAGKACNENSDCQPGLACINNVCGVDTCTNGQKDANESDVDCGANSGCKRCTTDQHCSSNDDCESFTCSADGLCVPGACTSAAANDIIINEVFTNPSTASDLYHSASKQMKYIELYNNSNDKRYLQDLKIEVKASDGNTRAISMTGCIDKKTYLVLYPTELKALSIDAKSMANAELDAALPNASNYTMKLVNKGTGALIHGASIPDMSDSAGVSAARPASPSQSEGLDTFVKHNSIPVDGGGTTENPHSPGLPNNVGIPMG